VNERDSPLDPVSITRALEAAGCVAAAEEADELIRAAPDERGLRLMVDRRLTGEPLTWITGTAVFCGQTIAVDPGVYVPRWQSEPLAREVAQRLPPGGCGVDLCTGSGAIAVVMQSVRPDARVVATELDAVAARCARNNGVTVFEGDLDAPLPDELATRVDVMTGVVPYVPTEALGFLPRDVRDFEPRSALDGGPGGLDLVARAVAGSRRWVRPGGWLFLEIGGDQVDTTSRMFVAAGYGDVRVLEDGDGDPRGIGGRRT
jgi:release factor glutamine methyltransferase